LFRRAGTFFAEAITPIETTHRTAQEANVRLNQLIETLNQHSADLIESNRLLKKEVAQRKTVEQSLRNSERHYGELLAQSQQLQEQLRFLSRQLLLAQEEERKRISRELHDEIAQTLTGINVRLAALKTEAARNTKGLQGKISSAQRMVEKSVDIVHRFARELRPTVLDDLGLIPALQAFVRAFSRQTRVHVRLTVYAGVERLDTVQRTVLFRVTQEALTNVARHARAGRVEITIEKQARAVSLTIHDDGRSFQADRVLRAKSNKRLGLLGMRERVEMIGGRLAIHSAPGRGTTISAKIPTTSARGRFH
jgi:signal transduction histidine kinase